MRDAQVTIIGAGLSGIMAARTLMERGVEDVQLTDKGRSVGGRLATRRIEGGKADHGAQFFTVRSNELQQYVDDWLEKGWVKHWFGDTYPRYTSIDGMNTLAKRLAEGLDPVLETRITSIKESIGGFKLTSEAGETCTTGALIITSPLPQTIALLEESTVSVNSNAFNQVKQINVDPSFVGLFEITSNTSLPPSGHKDENLPLGVERIVDHFKKGISKKRIISMYMDGEWSKEHFEQDESEIIHQMKEKIKDHVSISSIRSAQVKRWRYAQSTNIIHKPFLNLHEALPLYIAGDTFLHEEDEASRTRFESAFRSGIAAGRHVSSLVKQL
ncbi:NAD/FAD-dependent oxidoreductase [Pontibacillus chungwhensis BH030062]|uniref:NAD/FAD-dependent oxidoreductase n=1 Tax=Pontibacillus chungwhensis BH030062 TaxID=1385513 RepID=A0A0A2VG15_9BACI|nr:FAD-dependent oxidoreductase [Pontibacillus chungwhensis]KGP92575.1 NAD/FAD-dependent oxidoreductase [Pontibacillus chungwhensis BH030062]